MPISIPDSWTYTWIILPLLIFLARVVDVSFGTMRIVFIARGRKIIAPLLGFIEIAIWLLAIGEIFKNLNNFACYIAYASGFACGNYVGIWLEGKLALGTQVLRIITRRDATQLIENLKASGYGITIVDGEGTHGPIKVIFTLIKRRDFEVLINLVQKYNPKAFYSVEDVRFVQEGTFPKNHAQQSKFNAISWLSHERKGK